MATKLVPDTQAKFKQVPVCDWCGNEGDKGEKDGERGPLALYGHAVLSNLRFHARCYGEFHSNERKVFGLDKWLNTVKANEMPAVATSTPAIPRESITESLPDSGLTDN